MPSASASTSSAAKHDGGMLEEVILLIKRKFIFKGEGLPNQGSKI